MIVPFNNTFCRTFAPGQVNQTLDADKFKGKWIFTYQSKVDDPEVLGRCKVSWW
jgi:hypothetical protein